MSWEWLLQGLRASLEPAHMAWALAGCITGTVVGVLPGVGVAVALALLLPVSFQLELSLAMVFLMAIACGAMYGGSTSSILRNVPGVSASSVTALEGYRMANNGRAGTALTTAAIGSCVAGLITAVLVVWLAPWVAQVAQRVGPAERLILMVMAMGAVSAAMGSRRLRGVSALLLGLALGCWSSDPFSGASRWLELPWTALHAGLEPMVVAVGLLAVAPVLHAAMYEGATPHTFNTVGRMWLTREGWRRSWPAWLRGTAIGAPFGCLPVGGQDMPTYVSYACERYIAPPQHQAEFGREGAIEGVAGPEASNNATITTALIPLLAMGIPTSATAAMLLVAMQHYGVQPGPQWFATSSWVWTLLGSLVLINACLLLLNWPLVWCWVQLLRIPRPQVYAGLLVIATMGVYAVRQDALDVVLLYVLGMLGVAMRRFDFPNTPLLVGLVMGPWAEVQLRMALAVGGGWQVFVTRPGALALLALLVVLLVLPSGLQRWAQRRMAQANASRLQQEGSAS